jgi:putative membrane protein
MMMKHTRFSRLAGAAAISAALALAACSTDDRTETMADSGAVAGDTLGGPGAMGDTTMGADSMGAEGKTLADAQIFAMLSASNTAEIASGKLAQERATNAQVKAFARKMVTEHTAMEKQGADLATRINVTPTMPPDSALISDANDDIRDLQGKDRGADWDEEYLDKQVDLHQKTLDLIDRALASAQAAELKTLLEQARPKVQAHLDEAKRLKDGATS